MLKEIAKQLLPPIATNLIENLVNVTKHKHYANYAEALKNCSQDGYENTVLMDVLTYKMERLLENRRTNPVLELNASQTHLFLAFARLMAAYPDRTEFTVLDFGGGMGGHYLDTKKLLGDNIKLRWAVVETPAMVKAARQFATSELLFFDDIHAAKQHLGAIDLFHTSGTLQCVDAPYDFLKIMLDIKAPFMLFNRLGLNRLNRDVVTIHHSKLSWNGTAGLPPNVADRIISYPFTFISEANFRGKVSENYQIIGQFSDTSGLIAVPNTDLIGLGLLVERKKLSRAN